MSPEQKSDGRYLTTVEGEGMGNCKETRATALSNPELVDQLCDAVMSRLEERLDGNYLLSNGSVILC